VLPEGWITRKTEWHVNPTGTFVIGGPDGDAGLTGRKIIVDTYGGAAPHGGGAFSGKDPTKVDRSAAYAARYLAKNVVAAGLAERCTLQVSYAIGVAKPLSIYVDTHGTGQVEAARIEKAVAEVMDLTPRGIRTHLDLNRADLCPDQRLWPFRPRAGSRRRLLVGAYRSGRGAEKGGVSLSFRVCRTLRAAPDLGAARLIQAGDTYFAAISPARFCAAMNSAAEKACTVFRPETAPDAPATTSAASMFCRLSDSVTMRKSDSPVVM
jgi:hypothetical protein